MIYFIPVWIKSYYGLADKGHDLEEEVNWELAVTIKMKVRRIDNPLLYIFIIKIKDSSVYL